MVVEIPQGSRNKYEMDHETGEMYLDRMLFTATHYPADYGFVPGTLAEDGDPIDVMALVAEPTFPGCRIRVRIIGMFLMEDQGEPDHKLIGIPAGDPRWEDTHDIDDLPEHFRGELEHFFTVYKDLEDKKTAALGWKGAADASETLLKAQAAYIVP